MWTLVLTPWKNLCDQMVDDLEKNFWTARGWKPTLKPKVKRLYPSTLVDILISRDSGLTLVATFATLVTIFKKHQENYHKLSAKLSQVFVDEGHYEPAVEWGQAVKQLERPTLLLTATPYRNDLKLFRVSKDDVQHYTHKEAEEDRIIRKVKFRSLEVGEPNDKELGSWCDAFSSFWKSAKKRALHSEPRAIICCAKMATVYRVTRLLRQRGINSLGVHEGFAGRRQGWFKQQTPDPKKVPFDVWVHQNKLTEGLDDHRFCVLAVLNRIRNDRKLVQQIGRVLRRSRDRVGKALVFYSKGLPVKQSWDNYREFETQPDFVDPERYRQILKRALRRQPAMEYFGGRFRRRFQPDSPQLLSQVLLRASAVVRRVRQSFKFEKFTDFTSDFLLLEDCILLGPNNKPLEGPSDSRLWVYATFQNAPLLIEHSQYEIRLGATAAVKHGHLLFVIDTEGLYPGQYLAEHTKKISPDQLGRIFGKKTVPKEVSLTNPWPAGPTVHRSTIYADDLSATPSRLTDAVFECYGVRATVLPEKAGLPSRRHYVGFHRGRISEQVRSTERTTFSLAEFVSWTGALAQLIQAEKRTPPEFFRRYLSPIVPPSVVAPRFLILNLFEGDVELEDEQEQSIELVESIVEVVDGTQANDGSLRFRCNLRYRRNGKQEKAVGATLVYEQDAARFWLRGEELNSKISVMDIDTGEAEGLSTYLNNNDEAFTVALSQPDVFYTAEAFYRIDYNSVMTSQEIEEKLSPVLQEIETTGFLLNTKVLDPRIAYFTKHKEELRTELVKQLDDAHLEPGGTDKNGRTYLDLGSDLINFDDDNQVIATLNRIPGVSVTSRSKVTLLDLAEKPEVSKICELVIGMNHCRAMIHNHGECWREKAVNGYLYPKHKLERTDTGRLKSDFQQWQRPERIPGVPELREILSPRPGMTFVYTDFSQIEIRIAAQESNDPWLLGIIQSGQDVHAMIIAHTLCKDPQAFLTAYKDPTNPKHQEAIDVRSKHKGATFNILYGATARGMAESLGISTKKAEGIITKFFFKATALKEYAAKNAKTAVETNQITTRRGFQRPFDPKVSTVEQIARQGMNTPIQSGCADLLKLSMIYMREEFRKPPYSDQEPAALLANSMHDEVITQAYPKAAEVVKERMADALHRAVDELFPGVEWDFLKEIKISDRWLK